MNETRRLALMLCLCFILSACGRAGAEQPTPTAVPLPSPAVTELMALDSLDDLAGDWYGCWEMFAAQGGFAEYKKLKWDCCARIGEDGSLLLWDEDLNQQLPLASFNVTLKGDGLEISGMHFLDKDDAGLEPTLELKQDECGNMLVLRGRYESENGSFSFAVYIRPWGERWPEQGSRPEGYDSFYLSRLEKDGKMPESFQEETK